MHCLARFIALPVQPNPMKPGKQKETSKTTHLLPSSASSTGLLSSFLEEYHGFRSLADGAKGTPLSVSTGSAFFLDDDRIAADIWLCSRSSKRLMCPLGFVRAGCGAEVVATCSSNLSSSKSSLFRDLLEEDSRFVPARSLSKSIRASESCVLWSSCGYAKEELGIPRASFCPPLGPLSWQLLLHLCELVQYYRGDTDGTICGVRCSASPSQHSKCSCR